MKRNASYTIVGRHNRSACDGPEIQPQRYVYINEQNNRKDNSTIFHSPYKNGKRNPSYVNPSFLSSDVLYQEKVENSEKIFKKGIVPNKNEVKKQELRQRRLEKTKSQYLDGQSHSPHRRPAQKTELPEDLVTNSLKKELQTIKKLQTESISKNSTSKSRGKSRHQKEGSLSPLHNGKEEDRAKIRREIKGLLKKYFKETLYRKEQLVKLERENGRKDQKPSFKINEEKFKVQISNSRQPKRQRSEIFKEINVNQKK